MTISEVNESIGSAFRERRDLLKKIDCLKDRLISIGRAATTLADNPVHAESEETMQSASDVRDDYAALKGAMTRLAELDKILS